jgi:uncharacterized repeat protein (TIGR03806 family)
MRAFMAALACLALALFARSGAAVPTGAVSDAAILSAENPPTLSAFGFFNGGAQRPHPALVAYALGTALFSDYAEKQRFVYLPAGAKLLIKPGGRVKFPVGTALIKSFGYPDAQGKLGIIETRLLLHRAEGWVALPYVWRADGSDADLKLGGTRVPATIRHGDGGDQSISYAVPNKNQCKQCHSSAGKIEPIGPNWPNMIFSTAKDKARLAWQAQFPKSGLYKEAVWNDPKSGTVEQRALAYLRINCGHCHRPTGSASNSGLFYDDMIGGEAAMGIGKRPVAAGRGSGGFDFVIEPGHPERSILLYRLKSTDPGIAMPEVGRATVHKEGAALLEQWIREMKR